MNILFLVTHAKAAKCAVTWAVDIARIQKANIHMAIYIPRPAAVKGKQTAWSMTENPQAVRDALAESIGALPGADLNLLPDIDNEDPDRAIAGIVKELGIDAVCYTLNSRLTPQSPIMKAGQRILLQLPCDVLLIDFGTIGLMDIKRFIVPMDLGTSSHSLKYLLEETGKTDTKTDTKIVPLHVAQDFGEDSREIAERELELLLNESGIDTDDPNLEPQIALADSLDEGILQSVRQNDSIMIGGSSVKLIHDLRHALMRLRPRAAEAISIGIMRPAGLAARTPATRIGRKLKAAIPDLSLGDRVSLFDRIQAGSRLTPDFSIMIGLSVLIATCGLLADNSSVVIGAMLVAPLMTPLIGAGLALSQGNLPLLKRSAKAAGGGLLIGLILSTIASFLVPFDELPLEVLSRGDPDIVDMAIAFLSGMAAAYAVSRVTVAESIVGVAVAAALVPPLACVGIALGHGQLLAAEGAAILLITNLAAIALGAAVVFRWLGISGTLTRQKTILRIRWIFMTTSVILLLLVIPLGIRMAERLNVGQTRPLGFRVSRSVAMAVEERVESTEGMTLIFMGRSGSGQSRRVRILLSSDRSVPSSFIEDLRAAVREIQGGDTPVVIGVFRNDVLAES
jgi:uncharacterized hydrophobic protein (TIGR00271 family)